MAVMAVSSCEYSFDLKGLPDKGKVYMVCVPGGSDTTIFELKTTVPLSGGQTSTVPADNARVSLHVNGSPVELRRSDGSDDRIPEGSFYTLRKFSAGEELDFSADMEGFDGISARTVIPDGFPESDVHIGLTTDFAFGTTYENIELTAAFKDDPDNEDFYGIMVQEQLYHVTRSGPGQEESLMSDGYYYPYFWSKDQRQEEMSSETPELRINYSGGNRLNTDSTDPEMLLFNDSSFSGKKVELKVRLNYTPDCYYTLEAGTIEYHRRYRFIFFRLSPEFYNNAKVWYNRSHGASYIGYGIFPPTFVYTNIRNGLGLFGAVNVSFSAWMDNPGDMKDMGPFIESM